MNAKKLISIFIMCFVQTWVFAQNDITGDVIANAGFENGIEGWSLEVNKEVDGAPAGALSETDVVTEGAKAAKVTVDPGVGVWEVRLRNTPMDVSMYAGKEITVSLDAKVEDYDPATFKKFMLGFAGAPGVVQVLVPGSGEQTPDNMHPELPVEGGFKRYSITTTLPEDAANLQLEIWTGNKGTYTFDNVKVFQKLDTEDITGAILTNPTFESDVEGWNFNPSGLDAVFSHNADDANAQVVVADAPANEWWKPNLSQTMDLTAYAGKEIKVSMKVKHVGGDTPQFKSTIRDGAWQDIADGGTGAVTLEDDVWTYLSYFSTLPEDGDLTALRLDIFCGSNGTYYLDDFKIEEQFDYEIITDAFLVNPSFEDGVNAWKLESWGGDVNPAITASLNAVDMEGNGIAEVDVQVGANFWDMQMVQSFAVEDMYRGKEVSLFFKAKYVGDNAATNFKATLAGDPGTGGVTLTNEFVEDTITVFIPEDAETLQVTLMCGSQGKYYFDDFRITTPSILSLQGDLTIEGTPKVGSTLKAVLANMNNQVDADTTFQWFLNGEEIEGATDSTYLVLEEDYSADGNTLSVQVMTSDTGNFLEMVTTFIEPEVKGTQETPTAPQIFEIGEAKVVVYPTEGMEYSIDGGETWKNEYVFEKLASETEYMIIQRLAETFKLAASEVSISTSVMTDKAIVPIDHTANFILNPGFEIDATSNWDESFTPGKGTSSRETVTGEGEFTEGSQAIKVVSEGTAGVWEKRFIQKLTGTTALAGKEMIYSFDMKVVNPASEGGDVKKVMMAIADPNTIKEDGNLQELKTHQIWTNLGDGEEGVVHSEYNTYTLTYQVPVDTPDEWQIEIWIGEAGTYYLDNVTLKEIPFTKGLQETPTAKPGLANVNYDAIELATVEGMEYSIDNIIWYPSPLFGNLKPNTNYTFWQRRAGTEDLHPSDSSEPLNITTPDFHDTPIATELTIEGDVRFLETLTAYYGLEGEEGVEVFYQWKRNGNYIDGATNMNYTIVAEDIEKMISLEVKVTGKDGGQVVEAGVVEKANQEAPIQSEVATDLYTDLLLTVVDGCEYSIDGGLTWQAGVVFSNLEIGETYEIVQRYKETDTHYHGVVSEALMYKLGGEDIPTAIEDELKKLVVYPNPAKNIITIENLVIGSDIMIYNAIGNLLKVDEVKTQKVQINISELHKGIYFIRTNDSYNKLIVE